MTDLSPAAECVLNAVTLKRYDVPYQACPKSIDQIKSDVTVALRALADQVVPPSLEKEFYHRNPSMTLLKAIEIRSEILAIAAELEGQ